MELKESVETDSDGNYRALDVHGGGIDANSSHPAKLFIVLKHFDVRLRKIEDVTTITADPESAVEKLYAAVRRILRLDVLSSNETLYFARPEYPFECVLEEVHPDTGSEVLIPVELTASPDELGQGLIILDQRTQSIITPYNGMVVVCYTKDDDSVIIDGGPSDESDVYMSQLGAEALPKASLFEKIVEIIPAPKVDETAPLQFLTVNLAQDNFKGNY
jgi:hypothetical protein